MLLHELPIDHPARNTPLAQIGAEVRNLTSQQWRDLKTWRIGRSTYNELGPVWTECNQFRVETSCSPTA